MLGTDQAMLALLDLYLKAPVCYYESNDSFKLSDLRCQIFPSHLSLCGCIELYDVNVETHNITFSAFYFEMIFYFIKSIRLSGQWSGACHQAGPEIPTHHQSLINTEFQGFVAGPGLDWGWWVGGAPLLLLNDVLLDET